MIEAAIAGEGIAMSLRKFVEDDIQKGNLIQLFDYEVSSGKSYSILCLKENREKSNFKVLINWLLSITKE